MRKFKRKDRVSSWLYEYKIVEVTCLNDAIDKLYKINYLNNFKFSKICLEDIINCQEEGNTTKYFTNLVTKDLVVNEVLNRNISTITIFGTYKNNRLAFGYVIDEETFFISYNKQAKLNIEKLEKTLGLVKK